MAAGCWNGALVGEVYREEPKRASDLCMTIYCEPLETKPIISMPAYTEYSEDQGLLVAFRLPLTSVLAY